MKILLTGASGFIGSHVAKYLLKSHYCEIIGLDRYSISGNPHRFTSDPDYETFKNRLTLIHHDLKSPINKLLENKIGDIDYILHFGASTHVDRSITNPLSFVLDNTVGTCNLLEYARTVNNLKKFIYFSTDEVFGPAPNQIKYKEWDRYNSGNPYAASKAGAEELTIAYGNTYKLPIIITHTMNVYGEYQHPEKFIPSTIGKIIKKEVVKIHASPDKKISGSRFYIHAKEVARAINFLIDAPNQDKYNIVGEKEISNLELALKISEIMDKQLNYEMVDFHSSRPGHDLRYAMSGEKLENMGFKFEKTWDQAIEKTVNWYLNNKEWLIL